MPKTIDRLFRELFPARANESLNATGKLTAILNCDAQVEEDALVAALCEGILFQWGTGERTTETYWDLCRLADRVESILGVPIDGDEVPTILSLAREGQTGSRIAAQLRLAA